MPNDDECSVSRIATDYFWYNEWNRCNDMSTLMNINVFRTVIRAHCSLVDEMNSWLVRLHSDLFD